MRLEAVALKNYTPRMRDEEQAEALSLAAGRALQTRDRIGDRRMTGIGEHADDPYALRCSGICGIDDAIGRLTTLDESHRGTHAIPAHHLVLHARPHAQRDQRSFAIFA